MEQITESMLSVPTTLLGSSVKMLDQAPVSMEPPVEVSGYQNLTVRQNHWKAL